MARGLFLIPEPFDAEQVRTVCNRLRDQPGFRTWYGVLNTGRQAIRFRENPVEIAGISQKLEDLSPAADVHATRFVNRMEAAKVHVEVSSRSPDDADVSAAQRVEDFYYAFLNDMMRQRPGGILSPYRRHLDDMTALGAGFLHPALKPDVREKLGGKGFKDVDQLVAAAKRAFKDGFEENPFVVECPSLETVYFEPDLRNACEVGTRTISQVLHAYERLDYSPEMGFKWLTSDTMPEFQSEWQDTVTYYHLETTDFIYDLLDDPRGDRPFLSERRPNVAGRPWYTITPGHINNHPSPDKRFQPLIAAVYPTVQIMNVTRTLLQSGALNTGRPMYQEVAEGRSAVTLPEMMNQPIEQRPTLAFDPSQAILKKPRKGYRWDVVPVPSMEWVLEAYNQSKADLRDWGFPVGLSPEAPTKGEAESAAKGAQDMEIATNYLDPALGNVARSLHELLTLVGDAIKGFGLPVTIPVRKRAEGGDSRVRESITVKPDDFREQDLEVELKSIPATARIAIRESNQRQLQLGLMSRTTYMKEEHEDYLAEMERIEIDKAYAFAQEKALETVKQFITQNSAAVAAKVAAEQKIPLPAGLVPQTGGPAESGEPRFERPPGAPMQGVGTPNPIPEQAGPTGVPPSVGTEQTVRV